jgi:ABC-type branched-subunit amino acid transport system substrate-binding protein
MKVGITGDNAGYLTSTYHVFPNAALNKNVNVILNQVEYQAHGTDFDSI